MADFEFTIPISIDLDTRSFSAVITEWTKAISLVTPLASYDAASLIRDLLQKQLSRFPHPRNVPTPSLPYVNPPGMITGRLRDTIEIRRSLTPGSVASGMSHAVFEVYPTAPYARIQELGGFTGAQHATHLPPRPYFFPVITRQLIAVGPYSVEQIYYDKWLETYSVFYARPSVAGGFTAFKGG